MSGAPTGRCGNQPLAAPKFSALQGVNGSRGLDGFSVILRLDKDRPRRGQELIENEHCVSMRCGVQGGQSGAVPDEAGLPD